MAPLEPWAPGFGRPRLVGPRLTQLERREQARKPASPAAVEAAVCDLEQQSCADRLILVAGGVGEPVAAHEPVAGSPRFGLDREESGSMRWWETGGRVPSQG